MNKNFVDECKRHNISVGLDKETIFSYQERYIIGVGGSVFGIAPATGGIAAIWMDDKSKFIYKEHKTK